MTSSIERLNESSFLARTKFEGERKWLSKTESYTSDSEGPKNTITDGASTVTHAKWMDWIGLDPELLLLEHPALLILIVIISWIWV